MNVSKSRQIHQSGEDGYSAQNSAETVVMGALTGVWRRKLLVQQDGTRDDSSQVYWLQSSSICGDIRDEKKGPVAAFAGRTIQYGDVFHWNRIATSYEIIGGPDEGRLRWQGRDLREDGVHEPYWEIWERVSETSPADVALELVDAKNRQRAFFLSIGGYRFFCSFCATSAPSNTKGHFSMSSDTGCKVSLSMAAGSDDVLQDISVCFQDVAKAGQNVETLEPGSTATIKEHRQDGSTISSDWSVAILERPHLTSLFHR